MAVNITSIEYGAGIVAAFVSSDAAGNGGAYFWVRPLISGGWIPAGEASARPIPARFARRAPPLPGGETQLDVFVYASDGQSGAVRTGGHFDL